MAAEPVPESVATAEGAVALLTVEGAWKTFLTFCLTNKQALLPQLIPEALTVITAAPTRLTENWERWVSLKPVT